MYNSTDPKERAQALAAAEGVVRELRIELNQGTVELLVNHEDLRKEVEAETLTEARAIEIATGREKAKLDAMRTEAATTKSTNDTDTLALIEKGKAQLTAVEASLRASDTDYARLRPTFIAMLRPALLKTHASEWGSVAEEMYKAVKAAHPPVVETEVAPPVPTGPTPLRPKGSGGGSSTKESSPDSALAAVDAALASM